MTRKEKLKNNAEMINKFLIFEPMFDTDFYNWNDVDKLVTHIQALGYSFITAAIRTGDAISYTATFVDTLPPFKNKGIDKTGKSRLDAVYNTVIKFIEEYEPRPKIEDRDSRLEQSCTDM